MKKKLLLCTWGFPFGERERSFLGTEFQYLAEAFQVHILARSQEPLLYPIPDGVKAERYEYGPVLHLRRPSDLPSFFQLMIQPFRPSVFRELLLALRGCPLRRALPRVKQILLYSVNAWQVEKRLRRIVEEEKTDLIYTYWCTPATLAAVRLKKRFPGLKVVTRLHRFDLYQENPYTGWQPFRTEISPGCDRLLFVAEMGRTYYLETWGTRWASKSLVSYLGSRGLPAVPVRPEKGSLTLVSCSNMIPRKRVHLIVDALRLLPENIPVYWHHIGDGESRAALTEQAKNMLGPLPNVQWKFWGFVPNQELDTLYQTICPDVFIITSSSEGLPVSLMEASSAGIPAIATAVGGIPELVRDGETGFLLPENPSVEETTAAIRRFCALPDAEKTAMSGAARALWAEKFDAEKNAEALVEQLKQLLTNEGGSL